MAVNLTPLTSTANQWEVELTSSIDYNQFSNPYPWPFYGNNNEFASWTINWGDGTTETFNDKVKLSKRRHFYNQVVPPGNYVIKQITVTAQILTINSLMLQVCPNIATWLITKSTTVKLSTPDQLNCLSRDIKRDFSGNVHIVSGTSYRLECKIKQKLAPLFGFSHVKLIGTFQKFKNGRWKATRSIGKVRLVLGGYAYWPGCLEIFKGLNDEKTRSKVRKIKVKTKDVYLPALYSTLRYMPNAVNGDYIWYYNFNNSNIINQDERLIP